MPPFGEVVIEIFRFLCIFLDAVYTFDANLSNHERAVVHEVCRKMGMKSKSSG